MKPSKRAVLFAIGMMLLPSSRAQSIQSGTNSPFDEPDHIDVESASGKFFFCTTRIVATTADGKQTSTGTGFFFDYMIPPSNHIVFIVTCRHVVNGFASASFSLIPAKNDKPDLGHSFRVVTPNLQESVFYDPDTNIDVALMPISNLLDQCAKVHTFPFIRCLDASLIPTDETIKNLSAIQSILFIGYPYGLYDQKNILPLARRGYTATPYTVDFNGLPAFLIDANVYPGSSGSPVLVFDEGMIPFGHAIGPGVRIAFLGLVTSSYFHEQDGEIQFRYQPTQFVPYVANTNFYNIGLVLKNKAILNTMKEFVKHLPPS